MPDSVVIHPPPAPGLVTLTAGFGAVVTAAGAGALALFGWVAGWDGFWVACLPFLPFVGIGIALLALAWHFRNLAREPLVIELDGRVLYRGNVLFESATRMIVRLKVLSGEDGPYDSFILLADTATREVELPSPYFDSFGTRPEAVSLAARLAEALCIPVVSG